MSQRVFVRRMAVIVPLVVVLVSGIAHAQAVTPPVPGAPPDPPPAPAGPPPLWLVSAGAGLAVTSGNTDTSTINLAYEVKRDGGLPVIYRSAGIYLRGKTDDELNVDRALLDNRVDRRLTERLAVFGQFGYLRDRFKEIDYLMSPGGGVSYAFIKNDRVELAADGGIGIGFEKDTGFDVDTYGTVPAAQRFRYNLSDTASITESATALWRMTDFSDSIYTFSAGVASSLTANSSVKVELLDTYKSKPTDIDIQKNDVSLLVSLVYKLTRQ